ncbi:MAG: ABC transporter ATP-binding protein [Clostridia bacterium]|nr:ABC transporter ATP-binding protein [Clostridia bacterium]
MSTTPSNRFLPSRSRKGKKRASPPELIRARAFAAEVFSGAPDIRLDLNLNGRNETVWGAAAAGEGRLSVVSGQDRKTYSLKDLGEIRLLRGVGVASAETTVDGRDEELFRSDMRDFAAFESAVAGLEALRTGKPIPKPRGGKCPKCGRPYAKGSTVCLHCMKKKKLIGRMAGFAKGNAGLLVAAGLFLLLGSAVGILAPRLQSLLVDGFLQPVPGGARGWVADAARWFGLREGTFSGLLAVVIAMAACGLLGAALNSVRHLMTAKASAGIIVRIRSVLFRKVQDMSLASVTRKSPGELITRLSGDTEQLRRFLINILPTLLQQSVMLVAILAILVFADWKLTVFVVLPVPFLVLLFYSVNRLTHRIYHREWQLDSDANDMLHDVFSGIREVKVFGTEDREYERFDRCAKRIADTSKKNELIWNSVIPFSSFLLYAGEFMVIYLVGTQVFQGEATLGDLSMFLAYVAALYEPIRWFSRLPRMLSRSLTSMSKVVEVLDEKEDMTDGEKPCGLIEGSISFRDVSFGYNPAETVLKHVSLDIRPGDFIGLVGRSGVGKTTMINLMIRMYDATDGTVLLDGEDIRSYRASDIRSQVGIVLQETYLFNGTIYSNIAYAKPGASRADVIRAAKLAGAHGFIMKLPDGYNTYVGARGNTLSGGEKQRIAIARAVLRNPRLLILDEATSSLDTDTEKQIQEALAGLSAGRTTIAIAHRLSTLRNATKLAVFEKGELEELGTHKELMDRHGRYYRLVMAQREMNRMAGGAETAETGNGD